MSPGRQPYCRCQPQTARRDRPIPPAAPVILEAENSRPSQPVVRVSEVQLNSPALRQLFDQVRKKRLSPDDAVERLRHLPFEDLGFAKIDHHRALRQGMPEVIFAQGKTPLQVAGIFIRLAAHGGNVLATRASEEQYAAVAAAVKKAEYFPLARAIVIKRDRRKYGKGVILVVSAGTSDIPVAEEAVITAEMMGNNVQHIYDVESPASTACSRTAPISPVPA